MPDGISLSLFLSAAILLAISPGPGIFYVMTRSLKGGRLEGMASAFGTALGGIFHVFAAAFGLSALLASSAFAFTVIKYAGAIYLVYLGLKTLTADVVTNEAASGHAFYQGITVEALNPKTALFFLAFIPQFIHPDGSVFWQFILLGSISVLLNTSADIVVANLAGPIGHYVKRNSGLRSFQRAFTACGLMALGVYVALVGEA